MRKIIVPKREKYETATHGLDKQVLCVNADILNDLSCETTGNDPK